MAKQRVVTPEELEQIRTKSFFDCASPGVIKFMTDYYICGNSYKCASAELSILIHLVLFHVTVHPPTKEDRKIFFFYPSMIRSYYKAEEDRDMP